MKIEIRDKPLGRYINPDLRAGNVYQNRDNKQFYFACESIFDGMDVTILINLETGVRWNGSGGFGSGKFIDVTTNAVFVMEI